VQVQRTTTRNTPSSGTDRPAGFARLRVAALCLAVLSLAAPKLFAAPRAVLVEPLHVDRGEVEPDQVQKLQWTLRNDGDATLNIESLEPTCYCTTVKPEAWDVAPGGTTTIDVTIDPSDFVGTIHKGFVLETNDPTAGKMETDVEMKVRPGIAVVPPEIDFGSVPASGSQERTVDLKAGKERPFKVTSVSAEAPYVSVEQEPLQTEERSGVRLFVQVKPGAPTGPFTTKVVVQTDDAAKPRIEVAVRGTGAGGLRIDPEKLIFTQAKPGAEVGTIAVQGDKGVRVTGVRSTNPGLEAAVEQGSDGKYNVKVKVASGAKSGRLLAKLVVTTTDTAQPEITVPVMGLVQ